MYLYGFAEHPGASTLSLGGQLPPEQTPGLYSLHSVSLYDAAGNYSEQVSIDFGGNIDFADYFPSTKIVVVR